MTDKGRKKVSVIARNAARIGLGTEVVPIDGRATSRAVLDRLRSCDLIFACTDDHTGRADLARLATWFLIPVLDLGVRVDAADGHLAGVWGRINVQVPGAGCVLCWNVVDQTGCV